jgi:L-ascorbate metabolism protein UlaG (beta-lactamase superfamily)
MGKLFYQGHGSYRLVSDQGIVIYVDPFAGAGYDLPADIVLITHEHPDHNNLTLLQQNQEFVVIRPETILINGVYGRQTIHDIAIQAVPAYNTGHDKNKCVGYMDPKEASNCAAVIGAVHTIPIHMKPGALFDRNIAETFVAEGRLILEPNDEIKL